MDYEYQADLIRQDGDHAYLDIDLGFSVWKTVFVKIENRSYLETYHRRGNMLLASFSMIKDKYGKREYSMLFKRDV